MKQKDQFDLLLFINLALCLVLYSLDVDASAVGLLNYTVGVLFLIAISIFIPVGFRFLLSKIFERPEGLLDHLFKYGRWSLFITAVLWVLIIFSVYADK